MKSTSMSSGNPDWFQILIGLSQDARSCWVPGTDWFGVRTYAWAMFCSDRSIVDAMKDAGYKSRQAPSKEPMFRARDVQLVFGSQEE